MWSRLVQAGTLHEFLNLLSKARLVHDPEVDMLHQFPMRKWVSPVTIKTKNGRQFTKRVDSVKSDPENSMTVEEVKNKFRISLLGRSERQQGRRNNRESR